MSMKPVGLSDAFSKLFASEERKYETPDEKGETSLSSVLNRQVSAPNKPQVATVSLGTGLIIGSMQEGALAVREDREALARIRKITNEAGLQILDARQKIDGAIQDFYEQTQEYNRYVADLGRKMAMEIVRNPKFDKEQLSIDTAKFDLLVNIAKQIGDRFQNTAQVLMELQKLNSTGKLEDYKGVISLIFFARTEELILLGKRVQLLNQQEDHDMQIMVALDNQRLKDEEAVFDRILRKAKFDSEEDQRLFENEINKREQKRKEEKDIRDADLEKSRIVSHERLEKIKQQNNLEIEKSRISAEERVQREKIGADERCALAKTAADAATSTCVVM